MSSIEMFAAIIYTYHFDQPFFFHLDPNLLKFISSIGSHVTDGAYLVDLHCWEVEQTSAYVLHVTI